MTSANIFGSLLHNHCSHAIFKQVMAKQKDHPTLKIIPHPFLTGAPRIQKYSYLFRNPRKGKKENMWTVKSVGSLFKKKKVYQFSHNSSGNGLKDNDSNNYDYLYLILPHRGVVKINELMLIMCFWFLDESSYESQIIIMIIIVYVRQFLWWTLFTACPLHSHQKV